MGRTEPSVGQPPASFRRVARAKRAKATINQLIPSLLSTHPRARQGIEQTELIVEPQPLQTTEISPTSSDDAGPRLTLHVADTLTAARSLIADDASSEKGAKKSRVAILNMASPLSPGGGFLNGASSQEESLCMRTTLLPSLKDHFYRLPELGAVYTPDVLVFRNEGSDDVLAKADRYFVDCISAAMLRGPETERKDKGWAGYANEKDRELVLQKMRTVMRVCQLKGVTHIVLGAWGCGAYGNPVNEVASAWRKVLFPKKDVKGNKKKRKEMWPSVKEVVFAIKDVGMADAFNIAFGSGLDCKKKI
ncbi:hypothetical protein B0T10DRAFT_499434 [Thelonectria olida]|uniref:Microbial-type PARG catalytic domain-containing protein n=1 Tax=Thelonectria olida TaxID=1576542 RepID=A0A9P9AJH7_9HYPO|nr:hypothetical protein B0T10DRAFT_499434 [Thelonectria olida]